MFGDYMWADPMFAGYIENELTAGWDQTGIIKTVNEDQSSV